jgi:exopolysaccharide biosynthesis polyprenyl glycosylphosphotransferase
MTLSPITKLVSRVLLDLGCLFCAYAVAVWLATGPEEFWEAQAARYAPYYVVVALTWCAVTFDQHLYVSRRAESLTAILFSVTRIYLITFLFSGFVLALYLSWSYSRPFFVAFAVVSLAVMLLAVIGSRPSVLALRRRYSECRVLFVGVDDRAISLVQAFLDSEHRMYRVVGFLEDSRDRGAELEELGVSYIGPVNEIEQLLIDRRIDEVYLALPLGTHYREIERIAHLCETIGVPVRLVGDMFPVKMTGCDFSQTGGIPLLSVMGKPRYIASIQLKRATEALTTLILLVALAPLFAAVALLIGVESRGPVFVRKPRLAGGNGHKSSPAFRVHHMGTASPDDSPRRLTNVGRFVRRYGLEDLPQLVDVFYGRASFMGIPFQYSNSQKNTHGGSEGRLSHLKTQSTPTFVLAFLDATCISVAYVLAVVSTTNTSELARLCLVNFLPFWLVLVLVWYAAATDRCLWRWRNVESMAPETFGILKAVGNAAVVSGFLLAVFIPATHMTRAFLLTFIVFSCVLLLLFRLAIRFLTRIFYVLGYRIKRVVVVGANERTVELVKELGGEERFGYRVVGIVDDESPRADTLTNTGIPYLGRVGDLKEIVDRHQVDETFVTLPVGSKFDTIKELVGLCEHIGMPVHIVGNVVPLSIAKSRMVLVEDIPLISLSVQSETYAWLAIKRILDFVASTILIISLSPFFALIAVFIKLDSKGPVFFVQDRIGQNHRSFKMIKFRSMVSNAEDLKKDLMHLNEADGPVFKIRTDPRITTLGRVLRKYSLDELPQLFNVWLGHMSLVGPRPLMPHEVAKFEWFERRRLSVKPGMTGPWQVSGRSDISFREWVEMDLAYIDSWTFWSDFRILLKTFNAVFSGRGAA